MMVDSLLALMLFRLLMTCGGMGFLFAQSARRAYVKGTYEYAYLTRIMRVTQYPALLWGPSALAANVAMGLYFMVPLELTLSLALTWTVMRFRRDDDHDGWLKRGKRFLTRVKDQIRNLAPTPLPVPS